MPYDNVFAESVIWLFKTKSHTAEGAVAVPRGRRVRHVGLRALVQRRAAT